MFCCLTYWQSIAVEALDSFEVLGVFLLEQNLVKSLYNRESLNHRVESRLFCGEVPPFFGLRSYFHIFKKSYVGCRLERRHEMHRPVKKCNR